MNYVQFVERVQQRIRSEDARDAVRAIEATLKTLGERITEVEAAHLAAQLPPEIGRFLTVVDTNKDFDLSTFYENVSRRESIGQTESREHAQAVLSVVAEIVAPDELRDVLARLPEEYTDLFTFGSY